MCVSHIWNDALRYIWCARCAEMKRVSRRVHYKVAPCKVSVGLRVDPGAPYSIYNLIFCGCDMCAAHKVTSPGPCLAWGSELVRHTYRGSNVCALFHRKQIRKIISLCSREQSAAAENTRPTERALPMPFGVLLPIFDVLESWMRCKMLRCQRNADFASAHNMLLYMYIRINMYHWETCPLSILINFKKWRKICPYFFAHLPSSMHDKPY